MGAMKKLLESSYPGLEGGPILPALDFESLKKAGLLPLTDSQEKFSLMAFM